MPRWGNHTPDVVVVTHTGLVLAAPAPSGGGRFTLPSTAGVAVARLPHMVGEQLGTSAEPAPPLRVGEVSIPVVSIPTAALPTDDPERVWLSPEHLTRTLWDEPVQPLIEPLAQLLLAGVPVCAGSTGHTVRIGGTVRHQMGPWTQSVHAVLGHLNNYGIDAVPRVLGQDAWGRAIVSYLPGRRVEPGTHFLNDLQIAEATSWLLRLHEAMRGFSTPGPFLSLPAPHAELISHNDFSQHAMCFAGNRLVGVIEWDHVGPTTAVLELAWLAWSVVPLGGVIAESSVASRLRLVAETYGMDPLLILEAVPHRVELFLRTAEAIPRNYDVPFTHPCADRALVATRLERFAAERSAVITALRETPSNYW